MGRLFHHSLFIVLLVLLAGCAMGRKFPRPDHEMMELGKTSEQQVKEMFGKPQKTLKVTMNGENLNAMQYHYIPGHRDISTGISPATTMFVYLWQDKLVRYEYTSTERETSTNFDSGKVAEIKAGTTTHDEVKRMLGSPGGYAIFPGIEERDATAMIYYYVVTTGTILGSDVHTKVLTVPFDKNGIVLDVQFVEAGKS